MNIMQTRLTPKESHRPRRFHSVAPAAFTLIELLVVIGIIGILAGMLLPALGQAKGVGYRVACLNNVRQINLAVRMYADDSHGILPLTNTVSAVLYKEMVKSYLALSGPSSSGDKVFTCPADRFHVSFSDLWLLIPKGAHEELRSDYSSYWFNGFNQARPMTGQVIPGLAGWGLDSIRNGAATVLVSEIPSFYGYSWHAPQSPSLKGDTHDNPKLYNGARNEVSFVDGHISFVKIYCEPWRGPAYEYDPPAGYDYKWSAE
jgi:prepilin-type N-terminal cleavage/methylation domain-containing protein